MSRLSIVIPAHNEESYLPDILHDIADQSTQPYQIIVVDSMSTDGTAAVAQSCAARMQRLKLVQGPRTVGGARNEGAKHVDTEWILFLDSDIRLPRDFIKNLLTQIDLRGSDVYTAQFTTSASKYRLLARVTCVYFMLYARTSSPALIGHCIAVRTKIHRTIGGFNPNLALGEDHDYAERARRAGARLIWISGTPVIASPRRFEGGDFWPSVIYYGISELARVRRFAASSIASWYRRSQRI